MSKGRHPLSRRAVKRFLQLTAAAFAIGLGGSPALADDVGAQARANAGGENSTDESTLYRHRFELAAPHVDIHDTRLADLRVVDASGNKVMQLPLHGESMIGPLDDGSYTVLLRSDGLTEIHRIHISGDTLRYLHFVETV